MWKKLVRGATITSVGALGAVNLFAGCSSDPAAATPDDAGGAAETGPKVVDSGRVDTGIAIVDSGPTTCYDESKAARLKAFTVRTGQNFCTASQIDAYFAACREKGSTTATCDAATKGADAGVPTACHACLTGNSPSTSLPVVLPSGGNFVTVQWVACGYAVINEPGCGFSTADAAFCVGQSCDGCNRDTDKAGFAECQTTAKASDKCKDSTPKSCVDAFNAARPRIDPICVGPTFKDYYIKVANYFCGPPLASDGGGADASDDGG